MTADRCVLGNAANTELFMILPLTAGFLAAILAADTASPGWASLAGASGAMALLFKQVALPDVALYGLLLLGAPRHRWRLVAVFTLAAVALLSAVAVCFAAVGALDEFLDCVLLHNLDYASQVPWHSYPGAFLWKFRFAALQWWPILLLAIAGFLRPATPITRWEPRWLAGVWLLASFAGAAVGGYFREHYFIQLIPPLAVLAGRGAVIVRDHWFPPVPAAAVAAAAIAHGVLVMPGYWLVGTPAEKSRLLYDIAPFPEAIGVGAYLDRHAGPDDTIFVYGNEPEIYYYSRRRTASRYIFLYPLLTPAPGVAERQQAALDELAANRPRFIVVHRDLFPFHFGEEPPPLHLTLELQELLARDYKLVGIAGPTDTAVRLFDGTVPAGAEMNPPVEHTLAVWRRRES
jgi:4-amino-4-deoxy-L-arabinose transferase-like glycosyltransferase